MAPKKLLLSKMNYIRVRRSRRWAISPIANFSLPTVISAGKAELWLMCRDNGEIHPIYFEGYGFNAGPAGKLGKIPSIGHSDVNELLWVDFETKESIWFLDFKGWGSIASLGVQAILGKSVTFIGLAPLLDRPWYEGNDLTIESNFCERTISIGVQALVGSWDVGPCLFGCRGY